MRAVRRRIGLGLVVVRAVCPIGARGRGEEKAGALHEDFEGPQTGWRREGTDATVRLIAHERSDRGAHDGRTSERFHFDTGVGSSLYVSYPLPNVPIVKD